MVVWYILECRLYVDRGCSGMRNGRENLRCLCVIVYFSKKFLLREGNKLDG